VNEHPYPMHILMTCTEKPYQFVINYHSWCTTDNGEVMLTAMRITDKGSGKRDDAIINVVLKFVHALVCVVFGEAELSTELTNRLWEGRKARHEGYEYSREAGKRVETHQVGGACEPTRNAAYTACKNISFLAACSRRCFPV
jgi:hypothetical protein